MPISVNSLFFILFSSFIFLGALFSIVSKNMIYTLLSAIIVFLGVGGIFALLGAIYNAVVQLLVYVLVIPILIAVSIMFIKPITDRKRLLKDKFWLFLSALFFIFILVEFLSLNSDIFELVKTCTVYVNQYSDFEAIAQNLFSKYSFLLLEFGMGLIITVMGLCYYER